MSQGLTTEVDLSADEFGLSPDIDALVIEDNAPVDNLISEKQQRLLTEPLYSNENLLGDRIFLAAANVGVFYAIKQSPLVPDVFVSLDVEVPQDWTQKKNRSYLIWEFGKPPDIVIEIVSNREGNELGRKLRDYARMGVGYYAVFDPLRQLGSTDLYLFENRANRYQELSEHWFEEIQLGLMLWDGVFEGKGDHWLRWHDATGAVIPTGAELANQERQRANTESQRAETERQRAEAAEARAAQLAAQLRSLGINPDL
ncbi:Uma2 family endonuclease [Phormidium sp. CLA17]|uniref:Uma2 family endonuclease n=1 Tax=Leptolyngbya sp. Cla-17 TaxID=2803751 RepID=UPI001491F3BF|nr:Uma2 family endonuclease [Leptolyngbya sp. Cla-17]MBM0743453.1 Uma2 family endonuclease [Leptolyngbya sp. Cla-17]